MNRTYHAYHCVDCSILYCVDLIFDPNKIGTRCARCERERKYSDEKKSKNQALADCWLGMGRERQ